MPTAPSYPGVYIEEVPSGVRPITGVATSVAAFLGYFSRGPLHEAVYVPSRSDFERKLGGLRKDSEAAYALEQFFLNGGSQAWVVRTAKAGTPKTAAVTLREAAGGDESLTVTAASPGTWGNNLRLEVDYDTTDPATSFNLTVLEAGPQGTTVVESFRNLTMAAGPRHVANVINNGSQRIRVSVAASDAERPAATGTHSNALTALPNLTATQTLSFHLNSGSPVSIDPLGPVPTNLAGLAQTLQTRIRAKAATAAYARHVTVKAVGSLATGAYLVVSAGSGDPSDVVFFDTTAGDLADTLGLDDAAHENVRQYALGGGTVAGQQAVTDGVGADGDQPEGADLTAALAALDRVDQFNILAIPDTVRLPDTEAAAVMAEAEAYAEKHRAFFVLDVPHVAKVRDELSEITAWIGENATLRHKNAAVYYPRPLVADPLNEFRLRPVAPSGTVAGLYARTDSARGVWKAPAGTEATLSGVQAFEHRLTEDENGVLNPLAVNCLRNVQPYGNIAWGARTLVGADQMASEWKYVPVRRLALYLEESLYRGLQWVVFEPNDEPLWAQVRLNVRAFLQTLFRQGAFAGTTPQEAYLIKCDRETTTQADVDRGVVNIVVGFAPLKPAEFVIIRLQQLAGQQQA